VPWRHLLTLQPSDKNFAAFPLQKFLHEFQAQVKTLQKNAGLFVSKFIQAVDIYI
jgi:hypothetical protein